MNWLEEVAPRLQRGQHAVRVSVARVRGSAPREAGTAMIVTQTDFAGTIGGGQLEYVALARARSMLAETGSPGLAIEAHPLGAELAQCCGGHVTLLYERLHPEHAIPWIDDALARMGDRGPLRLLTLVQSGSAPEHVLDRCENNELTVQFFQDQDTLRFLEPIAPRRTPLMLYGAGHVGRALVGVLAGTDFSIRWIEERADFFPTDRPAKISPEITLDSSAVAASAPADAFHLVMTHSHDLDYRIVHALMSHGRYAWLGLIGSETKATCFRVRLARDGIADQQIVRLVSPIGIESLQGLGKAPSTIAIAVAAQLLIEQHRLVEAVPASAISPKPSPSGLAS